MIEDKNENKDDSGAASAVSSVKGPVASSAPVSEDCPDGSCGSCSKCGDFDAWKADLLEERRKKRASSFVVDKRTATVDFLEFADEQRINTAVEEFSEDEKDSYDEAEGRIIKSIMNGDMVLNETKELVFTPPSGKTPIIFKKPKGRSLMAMDRVKSTQAMKAYMEVITDMTNVNKANELTALDEVDLKTCKMVIQLFLGS